MKSEVDYLFLRTLDDLAEKVKSSDPYDLLAISAILRKLLLDGDPLVHQVNKIRRIKLFFFIGLPPDFSSQIPKISNWSIQDGFDPETGRPGRPTATVTMDGLLSAKILMLNRKIFTVRDIIKFEANIKGGIHAGQPKEQSEYEIDYAAKYISMFGERFSLHQMRSMGRVVLQGLSPLKEAILSS